MFRRTLLCCTVVLTFLISCKESGPLPETSDSPPRTPEEEAKTFQLEDGFEIQLVASEPLVESPVIIQFDEDGRLWVVEMRGYMNDMEGSEEHQPVGSVAILEDTDADGMMDKRTVYLDSLIMPRALGLFKSGALVAENNALWITQDLDGDWEADSKILLDSTYAANGIPEHSDNGFVRGVDNWFYSAKSSLRYRFQNGAWIRDSTEFRGQWGISKDDQGRLIYNYNWSQLHGDLVPPNYFSRNKNHKPSSGIDHGLTIDRRIYPIRSNPAINRGYIQGTLDSAGRLLEFTSACAPTVYRSGLFPDEYLGNVFVLENAGNLIKRNVVKEEGILLEAHDPNPGREFLASTDERFRPVQATVGPDGGLYIADMYQGIVQHGSYMTPYLKEQTKLRGLDAPGHMGRIWRIVPKGFDPADSPKLSKASQLELVAYLSHEDGWYRDMAQRLLIERDDPESVVDLEDLAKNGRLELGRFHALWTLEGMGKINPELLLGLLESDSDLLRNTSLRQIEILASQDPKVMERLEEVVLTWSPNLSEKLALQLALSAEIFSGATKIGLLVDIQNQYGQKGLIRDAILSSLEGEEYAFLQALLESGSWTESHPGQEIILEALTMAIVENGKSEEVSGLLALANAPQLGWKEEVILGGMAIKGAEAEAPGFVEVGKKPEILARKDLPMDEARIEMLKRLFSWPGYQPENKPLAAGKLDEKAIKQFALGRTKYLNSCAGCHGSNGKGVSRMGPPLAGSDWVNGDEVQLSLILLHGIEGPIEVSGRKYDAPDILPVMPSHSTMDDGDIAAILTYIRNEWGNQAPPVTGRTVSSTRHLNQGRVYPWSAAELKKHMASLASASKP
ncbi:c-type cytochrome [Algoriphagus aestuariicola]|uniref:C-type cytochrome n=1 Tax=Algoriphagus aestuariicola TaxID=1852016 RepID=A0ABS3BQX0_9BACT|nr:c-type cytochrome [Algoriphagus aestuariicola]MBN7801656.1 c-type cytochrome [Algoriphagus aestuariicola]